jgi:hypothetical protein
LDVVAENKWMNKIESLVLIRVIGAKFGEIRDRPCHGQPKNRANPVPIAHEQMLINFIQNQEK